jgi:hypothetical protein
MTSPATAESGSVRETTPRPACVLCGATDINFVYAAAAGWRRVLGRLACSHCAGRFPAWMRTQF